MSASVSPRIQQGGYQGNGGYGNQQGGYQNAPAPQQAPAAPPAQDSLAIGNLDEFETILSDGEVPF